MATATLQYNLDDPQDRMAHLRAVKSTDMANALFEATHNLKRDCIADVEADKNLTPYGAVELVFDRLQMLLESQNVRVEELID